MKDVIMGHMARKYSIGIRNTVAMALRTPVESEVVAS